VIGQFYHILSFSAKKTIEHNQEDFNKDRTCALMDGSCCCVLDINIVMIE